MCDDHFVSWADPMARLMATQRRAVINSELKSRALEDMIYVDDIQAFSRVGPHVCRVIITPEAPQWMRVNRIPDQRDEATWTQEQWHVWLTVHLR